MFKFFRKYQNWLIAVGCSLLMVVFLIENVMPKGGNDPRKIVLGKAHGEKVTAADRNNSAAEIVLLKRLGLSPLQEDSESSTALAWTLALRDAKKLGLDVSQSEVAQLLQMIGQDQYAIRELADKARVSVPFVHQAMTHWAIIQDYQDLLAGNVPVAPTQRLQAYIQAAQVQNQIMQVVRQANSDPKKYGAYAQYMIKQLEQQAEMALAMSKGAPRLSDPLVQRFVMDQTSQVKITLLPLSADRLLEQVPLPDEETLQKLFDQYKDQLPGQGKPFGLGYRFPDRVKIEYLTIPTERLQASQKVQEDEALAFYEQNAKRYFTVPATQPGEADKTQDYAAVRQSIIQHLKQEKAQKQADRMLKDAQAMLLENSRKLADDAGYKAIAADWTPIPLEALAEKLQSAHGLLPTITRKEGDWLDRSALENLPGIGQSQILAQGSQRQVSFADYVFSCRELAPKGDNPLMTLRLQTKLASLPMADAAGNRYLFRLTQAQATRQPVSLDEVRPQVIHNARQLAAYKLLVAQKNQWLDRLSRQSVSELAKELKTRELEPEAFSRHRITGKGLEVPYVQGVGENGAFVDAVFDLADRAAARGEVEKLPWELRSDVIVVEDRLSLALVQVQSYRPIPLSEYRKTLAMVPSLGAIIDRSLLAVEAKKGSMSLEAVAARTGFEVKKQEGESLADE